MTPRKKLTQPEPEPAPPMCLLCNHAHVKGETCWAVVNLGLGFTQTCYCAGRGTEA